MKEPHIHIAADVLERDILVSDDRTCSGGRASPSANKSSSLFHFLYEFNKAFASDPYRTITRPEARALLKTNALWVHLTPSHFTALQKD